MIVEKSLHTTSAILLLLKTAEDALERSLSTLPSIPLVGFLQRHHFVHG